MGKRELIIAAAFVVVAAVAYQLTAPAPKPGERRFSLTDIFAGIHRGMRANAASASITKSGTIAVSAGVAELRLSATRSVPLTVIGEKRNDIGYEAVVTSTGPDEAAARAAADKAELTSDDLNTALKLDLRFQDDGEHSGPLTLRVPNRMLIRVEGSGRLSVADVRAVDLRNLTGDVTITNLQEQLTGSHRSGELNVTHVGGIEVTLVSSRARFTDIDGTITLNARNGDCVIATSRGSVEATVQNAELTVTDQGGPIRVVGELGRVRVVAPAKDLTIDVRRMAVDVTLAAAVPATILTSTESLKFSLIGPPGLALDALATDNGAIRVTDFAAQPAQQGRDTRLTTTVGGGGPRVVLRNSGGDIVIGLRK